MIIWAASWPRSGSTLWRIVWHTYTGLPTFSYANDPILAKGDLQRYVGQKPFTQDQDKREAINKARGVWMVKTHQFAMACDPNKTMRKLLIVRDARAATVSLAHYTSWRKRLDYKAELARIIEQSTWGMFNGSWLDYAEVVVRYEDLRADPLGQLKRVVEKMALPVEIQKDAQLPAFGTLQKREPRFFRRGTVKGWQQELTAEQAARIWERYGGLMERLGYER